MAQQLTLGMTLGSDRTFATLVAGPNTEALAAVRAALQSRGQLVFLWGGEGSGRSHLLQALVHEAARDQRPAAMLPLAERAAWAPEILEGWDGMDLVALDDVDAIAHDMDWERAVFNLFNAVRDSGGNLVVTASQAPGGLDMLLPDLRSRLGSMLVYQWQGLDDDGRLQALRVKAKARGMELPVEAAQWLLARYPRDMHFLADVIERLDRASLAAQRRLTIPFIRELLQA